MVCVKATQWSVPGVDDSPALGYLVTGRTEEIVFLSKRISPEYAAKLLFGMFVEGCSACGVYPQRIKRQSPKHGN